jgi:hypothetical protein
MTLPLNVVEEDRSLEKRTEGATRALLLLRWHWTLDESNPARVSLKEYSRRVDVAEPTIRRDAHAGAMLQGESGAALPPNEARERASMGAETEAAAEAVAALYQAPLSTVRRTHRRDVRTIRDNARQRAEERGTKVVDEIPHAAAMVRRHKEAEEKEAETKRQHHTVRYIEVEASLGQAAKFLIKAIRASEGVAFTQEEREMLAIALTTVERLKRVADRAIVEAYDKTWQTELRVIEGGLAS